MTSKKSKTKVLRRSKNDAVIGGVCSGLAEFLEVDVVIIRLLWTLLVVFTGIVPGVLVYIIWWIIVPKNL